MTETDWLTTTNTAAMIEFIQQKTDLDLPRLRHKMGIFTNTLNDWYNSCLSPGSIDWPNALVHLREHQCNLLRDLFGNPFHPVIIDMTAEARRGYIEFPNLREGQHYHLLPHGIASTIDPKILTYDNGLIPRMAKTIHDEESYDQMPILADALEEAGCSSHDVLEHCRNICPVCGGVPIHEIDSGGFTEWGAPISNTVHCIACNMTGKTKGVHCQGCWVLELFLPESILYPRPLTQPYRIPLPPKPLEDVKGVYYGASGSTSASDQ